MTCEEAFEKVFFDLNAGRLSLAARGAYWTLCVYEGQLLTEGALRLLLGTNWRALVGEIERFGVGHLVDLNNSLFRFRHVAGVCERRRVKGRDRMRARRQKRDGQDE